MRGGRLLLAFAVIACAIPALARADALERIERRGAITIGVKGDYPPFGMIDASGQLVGFDADLAADVAARLGVSLTLRGVTSANRLQLLEQGEIDVVIATLGDTTQRRAIATLLEPSYYASGANIMLHRNSGIAQWSDLRGRTVCATQGALFNRAIAERYLLDLATFNGTRDAQLALRDGRCVGWLYDDTAIGQTLRGEEWADYHMPLPSTMLSPWAVALAKSEDGGALETTIADMIAAWHRDGLLLRLEKKWDLHPSVFVAETHELWKAKDASGQPVCRRQPDGAWPPACRNESLLTSQDVSGVHRLSLVLRETLGVDISLLHDAYDRNLFLGGLLVTLKLVVACVLGSLAIGIAGGILIGMRLPLLSRLLISLATMLRMTPPLLQIYVVFFGLGSIVVTRLGWTFDGFIVATLCLSGYAGASNMTAFADAWRTLDESGIPVPPDRPSVARVFRAAYGPIMGSCVNIVKATGMASVIAVPELVYATNSILAERGNAAVMMNILMVAYFLLVLGVVALFEAVERRLAR